MFSPVSRRIAAARSTARLHDDRVASLQLYEDGTWYCYGTCRAGGSIFDFAARIWGCDTKDRAFLRLRARLAAEFGLAATT